MKDWHKHLIKNNNNVGYNIYYLIWKRRNHRSKTMTGKFQMCTSKYEQTWIWGESRHQANTSCGGEKISSQVKCQLWRAFHPLGTMGQPYDCITKYSMDLCSTEGRTDSLCMAVGYYPSQFLGIKRLILPPYVLVCVLGQLRGYVCLAHVRSV